MELHCEQLQVRIGHTRVVEQLELGFQPGEFWAVLGANGSGKTTLLRNLAHLLEPAAGVIRLARRPLGEWPRRALARTLGMLQQHTQFVFDAPALQVALTGRHPYLGPWDRESASDRQLALDALAKVELSALGSASVTRLSGGEVRRLAFAMLLVQDPQVLLLDEPTNHLDFRHQVRVLREVGDLVYSRGRLALAALHDVNLAATYCSHVLFLYGDGAWDAGPASQLLKVENLERLFQCPVSSVSTPDGTRFHPAFGGRAA